MLNWAKYPDEVFHAVVGDALDIAHDLLKQHDPAQFKAARQRRAAVREQLDWLASTMPRTARFFGPEQLLLGKAPPDDDCRPCDAGTSR